MVSCTFPNLYQLEVIKQRLKRSRQTEFPIWSIPIATERKIPPKYQSPFLLAEFQEGKKNLNQISPIVRSSPSGSNTTARARATIRSMRLCSRFLIFFSFWIKFFYSLWEFHLKCFEFFVFFETNKFWDIINIYILYIGNSTCSMNI